MRIHWTGMSTNGLCKWKADADTMHELYTILANKNVICINDEDPYEKFILNKYGKTIDDAEFQDSDGDLDCNKLQNFVESHCLSDSELWRLITEENGNAYYQTLMIENSDGELVELDESHFDESGSLRENAL